MCILAKVYLTKCSYLPKLLSSKQILLCVFSQHNYGIIDNQFIFIPNGNFLEKLVDIYSFSINVIISIFPIITKLYYKNLFCLEKGCLLTKIMGRVKHNQSRKRTTLTFSSDDDLRSTYRCKLDDRKFQDCEFMISCRINS